MQPLPEWPDDFSSLAPPPPRQRLHCAPGTLPPEIEAVVWRADQFGSSVSATQSTGYGDLDAELPGAGWPCHSLTEILQPQPTVAEWRLLAPAMRSVVAAGGNVVIVGPPKSPHLPGLQFAGLDERHFIWIQAQTPAERLWVTEQLVRTNAAGLLVSWLPQARPEQIRRLQVCAQGCEGPVFLCRPDTAKHEPSAAPLRVQLSIAANWELRLHLLKRKGPVHDGTLALHSVPGGLESILTPRLAKLTLAIGARSGQENLQAALFPETSHAVGGPASRTPAERRIAAH